MQIRRLEPRDATIYRAFRLRGFRDHPDAFSSSFEEENLRPPADAAARLSSASSIHMWGALTEGGRAAELMGVFGFAREERIKTCHKATLIGMFVAPEFSGLGVGRALVEAVMQDARADGIALLVLTVTEGNARARALYARAGFQTIGIEPDAIRVHGASFGKEHMALQITPALHPLKAPPAAPLFALTSPFPSRP